MLERRRSAKDRRLVNLVLTPGGHLVAALRLNHAWRCTTSTVSHLGGHEGALQARGCDTMNVAAVVGASIRPTFAQYIIGNS